MQTTEIVGRKCRWLFPDLIRGITLFSMILYHATYDIVEIGGVNWHWFYSSASYIWQQSICWSFLLLSGFCFHFGKKQCRRGMLIFGAGILLTFVTLLVIPQERVIFGVLTLTGSSMMLVSLFQRLLKKISAGVGFSSFLFLFFVMRNVNSGYLGFEFLRLVRLPDFLFQGGYFMTYLGFPFYSFFSSDYFSLIPWMFLYITGYYLYEILEKDQKLELIEKWSQKIFAKCRVLFAGFRFLGKHSLLIYLLHQPVLYGCLLLWMYTK